MTTLYVLRLTHGKWYVGTTMQSPRARLAAHERGAGSAWTRAHRVLEMVHTRTVPTETAGISETAKTIELMRLHGVDAVRGGSYCQRVLSAAQLGCIKRELCHNDGGCLRCGRRGHFATRCYARTHVDGRAIKESESESEDEGCYRCGRDGHYVADCYARTHADGRRL